MRRLKQAVMVLMAMVMVLGSTSASAAVFTPETSSTAALLVDLNTGRIVAEKNGDERLPLGSVSKLVVAYFIEEAVAEGKLSWDQKIKIKPKLAEYSHDMSVATVPLYVDGEYTLEDLMNATLLPSSNSASLVLADLIAGDQEKFNEMANEKLASWGIPDANWSSASGLPVGALGPFQTDTYHEDDMNRLSAREVAIIAGRIMQDYPHMLTFNGKITEQFPDGKGGYVKLENTNELLKDKEFKVLGMKTGTILEYGKNLVAKTSIHGVPVLSVVLNARPADSETEVFTTSKNMWHQASAQLKAETLDRGTTVSDVKDNQAAAGQASVSLAKKQSFLLGVQEDMPKFDDVKLTSEVPYKAGETIGSAKWQFSTKSDNYLPGVGTVKVMTDEDVEPANWFVRTWRSIFG
ncbi:D-alanyl-D-alanine carboxypeptidase family protein [Weissella tructae]|uniref:Serine-type D-Ala-D-Ala carboxypeptidase n=2 Tax=Weissella TaxID=46255 RepID=A0A075U7J8_9LACO|nr:MULTISPECIES: serine hydrolase [Weissella]AIG66067.1 Serine-type D-Ala-D-Ala carboxypeptidase [Weissella tructae]AIM63446.1 Serine-type D-Ala-D-Ala carboxypeptidase [Weissella ceti]AIM64781.1 Serine-type D-Ala-D-Ala carboxypeptidase [Weissella ceti]ELA07439.1 D-alanyl-D-alanine carboxypeptidase [Weissella ceti NC36]